MSTEIRPVRSEDEWRQHAFAAAYAFNGDRSDEAADRKLDYYKWDWTLAAFDGAQVVAGLVVIPFETYFAGVSIPTGGVASVSCLPERRRGGYVGALLRAALARMRDAGQPLAQLYTPHYSLYRKYGWELAGRMMSYAFPPKMTKLRLPVPGGSLSRITADDWETLDDLYRRHYAYRIGALNRSEARWRTQKFRAFGHPQDAVIWRNAEGQPRAYAIYRSVHRPAPGSPFGETTLRVEDWLALDSGGYSAILQYLLNHDLVNQIVLLAGSDEPLAEALEEPFHVKEPPGAWFGPMIRIVDLPAAIAARPARPQADGHSLSIAITDTVAPWNTGTWHIDCSGGRMAAERTNTPAGLEIDIRTLAPLYNGFVRAAEAARIGTVRVLDVNAIAAATDIFSTEHAPYCPDDF